MYVTDEVDMLYFDSNVCFKPLGNALSFGSTLL